MISDINYEDMVIDGYKGNPLIEAVGWGIGEEEFSARCDTPFNGKVDFSRIPENRRDFAIRSLIGSLKWTYVVKDEGFSIYETMLTLIHQGYVNRNLLSEGFQKMLVAIERDMNEPLAAKYLKAAYGDSLFGAEEGKGSSLLAGLSGDGKTSMVLKALQQIKRTLHHSNYKDINGNEHELNFTQQTYLYVKLNTRKGQKALLKSILAALDEDTGENYSFIYRNADVTELITGLRKAMIIHGVGLLIIDEAQNFSRPLESIQLGANEKTSIRFVEEIFNSIGVPLFFVGTHAMLDLFGNSVKTIRRVNADGGKILYGSDLDSDFWERFCRRIFRTEFLKNQKTDYITFKTHLHVKSQGVTAIAKALTIATLQFLTKLPEENQDLGIESIDLVFTRQFKLLTKPLAALRDEQYQQYEDYHILAVLEEIEEQELAYKKAQECAANTNLKKAVGNNEASKSKHSTNTAKLSKNLNNAPELDIEGADKIGFEQMMVITGG